jgi:YD repeat-containing protein
VLQGETVQGAATQTRYAYDADGTSWTSAKTRQDAASRRHEFDARGNLTLTRDKLGATITRTYDEHNQILTETRYEERDTDGAGTGVSPERSLTTRNVYDSERHPRAWAISVPAQK